MILLCDSEAEVFGTLWHINSEGAMSIIKYGPGQLSLAKEHIPRGEPYFVHANVTGIWRCQGNRPRRRTKRNNTVLVPTWRLNHAHAT